MSQLLSRPIKRLLVANRGEIATRIISTARELDLETYALYTSEDVSHTQGAAHALKLSSPASYLNTTEIIALVQKHQIDAVHPGYGFLSESAEFARRMWDEAGVMVVGPGWEILERTGDKLKARLLAERCHVPVLPALQNPTGDVSGIRNFAAQVGYPVMVKAVDGGGGRGIRLIRSEESLESLVRRAIEESPSRQVFAEKAAVDGYRHVEVQIIGDRNGDVRHLWERECSIQRRYQKVVEMAPSSIKDRKLVAEVIEAALRMAKEIGYLSLGTFEFLVSPSRRDFYFLEINPRLQVEHTITESICQVDIVKVQLLLAQGASLSSAGLSESLISASTHKAESPPPLHSLQLRITAENVQNDYSLSIGKIQSFQFPTGNGIRIDTNLINGQATVVSADFDSLLAKLIITAPTWDAVLSKARRALEDTRIHGVKTNLAILRAIVAHPDFAAGSCDTRWLESNHSGLLKSGEQLPAASPASLLDSAQTSSTPSAAASGTSSVLFRKGDAWSITLSPSVGKSAGAAQPSAPHHLQLTRLLRNEFPASLAAEILYTAPSANPVPYTLTLNSTSASSSALQSHHRRGNPSDPAHVVIPFSGKLVEVLVDEGDVVKAGDVVCVVQQMKMELEVRASRGGRVGWVMELEDGEDVAEGMLAAVVEGERVEAKL